MAKKKEQAPIVEAPIKVKRQRRRIYEEPAPEPAPEPIIEAEFQVVAETPLPEEPAAGQEGATPGTMPVPAAPGGSSSQAAPPSEAEARAMIRQHMLWAMGIGLVPLPLLDTVAVTAVQILLLRKLAQRHGVAFSPGRARGLVASLVGGAGAVSIATGYWGSWIKAVPVVGPSLGAATMPVLAGASTWALGLVFLRHFQAGGTLADFNPLRQGRAFAAGLAEGKREARAQRP